MGSKHFYHQVRAGFVAKRTSLNAWCMKNKVTRQYAENVLQGKTNGPGAKTLAKKIAKAAGVDAAKSANP